MVPIEGIEPPTFGLQNRFLYVVRILPSSHIIHYKLDIAII
jgi:hypothetical protein